MVNHLPPFFPPYRFLHSPDWQDYRLLDSGDGMKLEKFGPYTLVRPEIEAIWHRKLPESDWRNATAKFVPSNEKNGGHWEKRLEVQERWEMGYKEIRFYVQLSASRHLGVFPEQASQWDMVSRLVGSCDKPPRILNLFGYTGLASLSAARAGAQVTHVDASKKAINWSIENQRLSGLEAAPIRWLVDDAYKYVKRDGRRKAQYDGLILDPPKFGRGPKGEVWEFYKLIPMLLDACQEILSPDPLFVLVTAYSVKASALTLYNALQEMLKKPKGNIEIGETTLQDESGGRSLSTAVYGLWSKK